MIHRLDAFWFALMKVMLNSVMVEDFIIELKGDKYYAKEAYVRVTSTILHFALQNHTNHSTVEALLHKFPVLSHLRDSFGELAFHYAVRNHASAVTLHTLLRSNPRSGSVPDRMNRLPVQYLLKHYAENERRLQDGPSKGNATSSKVTFSSPWSAFLSQMSGSNASRQLMSFRRTLVNDRKLPMEGSKGDLYDIILPKLIGYRNSFVVGKAPYVTTIAS